VGPPDPGERGIGSVPLLMTGSMQHSGHTTAIRSPARAGRGQLGATSAGGPQSAAAPSIQTPVGLAIPCP
jgi:hypothetical protein